MNNLTKEEKIGLGTFGTIAAITGVVLLTKMAHAAPASLAGIVYDMETSIPITDYLVKVNSQSTYTDIDGSYMFPDLEAKGYTLVCPQTEVYRRYEMSINLTEGENMINIPLTAKDLPIADAAFTIVDSDTGNPIEGVTVTLASIIVTTNAMGKCTIANIAPGSYSISFSHPDYQTLEDVVIFQV